MNEVLQISIGDVISTSVGVGTENILAVVVQVDPAVNASKIIEADGREVLSGDIGTVSGKIEILGRWSLGKVIEGFSPVFDEWGLPENRIQQMHDELRGQLDKSPVPYDPSVA